MRELCLEVHIFFAVLRVSGWEQYRNALTYLDTTNMKAGSVNSFALFIFGVQELCTKKARMLACAENYVNVRIRGHLLTPFYHSNENRSFSLASLCCYTDGEV